MLSTLRNIQHAFDKFTEFSGKLVSWLVLALVLLVSYDVTMRYLFQSGSIALQEWEWHLFSIIFLLGAAYTLKHDDHVRLDLFYKSQFMNPNKRAWVNLLGSVFVLIPFSILIIISSWPFVEQAYIHMESSPDPGGLTNRWLLKAAIPTGFFLLIIQGISQILENLLFILTGEEKS